MRLLFRTSQILTAKALIDRTPRPTDAQIRDDLAGVLCRCMTYYRVQAAIKHSRSRDDSRRDS